jgi:hypothetical protein
MAPSVQLAEQPKASQTAMNSPQSLRKKPFIEGLTRQQTVRGEVLKFLQALGYSNKAGHLAAQQPGLHSNTELEKTIALRTMALETAKSVDIEILDSIFPAFGTHFRWDFIKGVELFLAAVQSSSDELLGRSREALNRWADWYDANRERIELAINAE